MLVSIVFLIFVAISSGDKIDYSFPKSFLFGTSTSAYQVEGAWNISGKGISIWDNFTHLHPESIADHSNADISCDSYHKYKEDVKLVKNLGVNFHRISISWTRILPNGKNTTINEDGLNYYNNVINELLQNGIEPYVVLFHFDLPQNLQDEGGWLNSKIIDYYLDYARIIFSNFADRVKMFITFNEPYHTCESGYGVGTFHPNIKEQGIGGYKCAHNLLLAHGNAWDMYQREYKNKFNGSIGISVDGSFYEPLDPKNESDVKSAERSLIMNVGWFLNPLLKGNYPKFMIERIKNMSQSENLEKSRLPEFSSKEIKLMNGSYDFIGLNYYSSRQTTFRDPTQGPIPSNLRDVGVTYFNPKEWPLMHGWLPIYPEGLRKILIWIKKTYHNPPIIITENGMCDYGESQDFNKINYIKNHLYEVLKTIHEENCNVFGYTYWSLMDNFEWESGYTKPFGLYKVNFSDPNRTRSEKLSAKYYKNIIQSRKLNWDVKAVPDSAQKRAPIFYPTIILYIIILIILL